MSVSYHKVNCDFITSVSETHITGNFSNQQKLHRGERRVKPDNSYQSVTSNQMVKVSQGETIKK